MRKLARCAVLLLLGLPVIAASLGPSLVSVQGRRLMVGKRNPDGTLAPAAPYLVRGVNWSPASRATSTSPPDPNNAAVRRVEFYKWYATDIPSIKGMNANTVRLPLDPGTDAFGLAVLDALDENGIMAVVTVDNGVNDTRRLVEVVNALKNHPAVLAWTVGNEWNINNYYGVASSVMDAAQRTQAAAVLIKSLDHYCPKQAKRSRRVLQTWALGGRKCHAEVAVCLSELAPPVQNYYRPN